MNPSDRRTIEFYPPEPTLHRDRFEKWQTMSWIKFCALYERPFWQSHTTANHFLDEKTQMGVYDVSPEAGSQDIRVGLLSPNYSKISITERKVQCLNFRTEICG
jgi:monoamine oxidase